MNWAAQAVDYWRSGGVLLVPIALVSFGIWFCFVRSRQVLSRTLKDGADIERAWDRGAISGANAEDIAHELRRFGGGIAATLEAALRDICHGTRPEDAFAVREAEATRLLKRDFVLLGAFTAVAPLFGLLGTVIGMVETFQAVASVSGNTGERVAAGISRALITTQFGLVVALPGVFGHARLRRMLRQAEVVMAGCRAHALAAVTTHRKQQKTVS